MDSDIGKADYLSLIGNVMHEHEAIQASVKSLRNCNHDLADALALAEKSDWTQDKTTLLVERLSNLKDRLSDLEDGFKVHFKLDEEAFPIMGDLMLQAIRIDHQDLLRQFAEDRKLIIDVTAENVRGLGSTIVGKVNGLTDSIETPVRNEVDMLQLIGKVFQGNA